MEVHEKGRHAPGSFAVPSGVAAALLEEHGDLPLPLWESFFGNPKGLEASRGIRVSGIRFGYLQNGGRFFK